MNAAFVFFLVLVMGLAFLLAAWLFAVARVRLASIAFCVASAICLWFPANVIVGRYEVSTDARNCYSRNLSGCFQKVETNDRP